MHNMETNVPHVSTKWVLAFCCHRTNSVNTTAVVMHAQLVWKGGFKSTGCDMSAFQIYTIIRTQENCEAPGHTHIYMHSSSIQYILVEVEKVWNPDSCLILSVSKMFCISLHNAPLCLLQCYSQ